MFTVFFSPTQEGLFEDNISVHSSIGKFPHKVQFRSLNIHFLSERIELNLLLNFVVFWI